MKRLWRRSVSVDASVATFLAICAACGGGSRQDIQSLAVVRFAAIALLAMLLWSGRVSRVVPQNVVVFVGAATALVVGQLLPLPPELWTSLAGREVAVGSLRAAGLSPGWHALSLSPDGTLNMLVSLAPPIAALLGFCALDDKGRHRIVMMVAALVVLSACLGILQLAEGPETALRLYDITNRSSAVGVFANRNHQAAMLATGIPVACLLIARTSYETRPRKPLLTVMTIAAISFLLLAILTSGSRSGLAIGALVVLPSIALLRARFPLRIMLGVLLPLMAAALFVGDRLEALQRIRTAGVGDDVRFALFGDFVRLAIHYFPAGAGFGSFVEVYQVSERAEMLAPTYMNHAHIDPLELVIEGGLPALALAIVFLVWWSRQAFRAWRVDASSQALLVARLGSLISGSLMVASLSDYPLRTPLLAALFACACGMMIPTERTSNARRRALDRRADASRAFTVGASSA